MPFYRVERKLQSWSFPSKIKLKRHNYHPFKNQYNFWDPLTLKDNLNELLIFKWYEYCEQCGCWIDTIVIIDLMKIPIGFTKLSEHLGSQCMMRNVENLNGVRYLYFLQQDLAGILEDIPIPECQGMLWDLLTQMNWDKHVVASHQPWYMGLFQENWIVDLRCVSSNGRHFGQFFYYIQIISITLFTLNNYLEYFVLSYSRKFTNFRSLYHSKLKI